MSAINIHDAKTHFSRLIDRVAEARKSSPPVPAGRWRLSQAQIEGMTLLTRDAAVLRYGAPAMLI